ncbi:hypothetical protein JAAARDRAFT_61551 [Jaapia argillacea MUCL 33604]|uniref:Uncharacterized protein n=1 Tax=Jaapia argillacea MUCL 33604 TaxID=933084 RepID=A0A067PGM3_9AGAM|nr:hypothetical protein JAAARDRAFT_61551 [Jaapia argillacea MUCL 33604]
MSVASSSSASGSSPESDGMDRVVRFDSDCVLIPEAPPRSRRPRIVMKSYSLPLWNRNKLSDAAEVEPHDEGHVLFKVSVPRIITKSPRPGQLSECSSPPMPPCLVHHEPGSPRSPPARHIRRTSTTTASTSPRPDAVIIPLRACCPDCYPITEESLKEGDEWKEKFTRGARRRRSASSGSETSSWEPPVNGARAHHHTDCPSSGPGITAIKVINVDEVDKRRRSQDHLEDDEYRRNAVIVHAQKPSLSLSSCSSRRSASDPGAAGGGGYFGSCASETGQPGARRSPIQEEDEDQLFPLPSPRRSPSASPSPTPSPNGSSSCLAPCGNGSGDSLGRSPSTSSTSDEAPASNKENNHASTKSTGKSKRVKGRCEKGLLAPDPSRSKSSPTTSSTTLTESPSPTESRTSTPTPGYIPPAPRIPPPSAPISIPSSLSRRTAQSIPDLREGSSTSHNPTSSPSLYTFSSSSPQSQPPPPPPHDRRPHRTQSVDVSLPSPRTSSPSTSFLSRRGHDRQLSVGSGSQRSNSASPERSRGRRPSIPGIHMHLPGAVNLLRAGAEALKGVSVMGGGSSMGSP